ncbi:HAMP domain-containing sensor histidine kinase [Streptosporangium sp. NPDC048047]|uniref:sensor histidine kinase n=1 Tax=Streptosporangium sp. NPDC048047 TaxID=3155748 RepID=UPI00343B5F34
MVDRTGAQSPPRPFPAAEDAPTSGTPGHTGRSEATLCLAQRQRQIINASHRFLAPLEDIKAFLDEARAHPWNSSEAVDGALLAIEELKTTIIRLLTWNTPAGPADQKPSPRAPHTDRCASVTTLRGDQATGPGQPASFRCEQTHQFLANAAHELLTPLTGARTYLDMTRLHLEDAASVITGAQSALGRLEAVISDLLLLSDILAGPQYVPEQIDLDVLVADLITRRPGPPLEGHRIRLRWSERVKVEGEPSLLTRAVATLLEYARRHAAMVHVHISSDGHDAILSIYCDDDRRRLPDLDPIFEPFSRKDTSGVEGQGGTGLELAIASEVLRIHHGTIRADDTVSGLRLLLRLPLSSATTTASGLSCEPD